MRRRDFLSLVSCAALAAIVPRPKYFFLNGVWQNDPQILTLAMMQEAFEETCRRPPFPDSVQIEEIWVKENGKSVGYQRIGFGPWTRIPNLGFHGMAPFIPSTQADPPWFKPTATLQPDEA